MKIPWPERFSIYQGCGSELDPDSETLWIRIRIEGQENEEISVEKGTF
jgi:hypothetical protein